MDPDELLRALREAVQGARQDIESQGYVNLADVQPILAHFWALDTWLSRGGSRPAAWEYVHPPGDKYLPPPEEEVSVPKDSCEANHPTRHLQCWGEHGHEGDHFIGSDPWHDWWANRPPRVPGVYNP